MLNRIFGTNTHNYLHILGLCGIAFGLPLNKVVMSISMMFIVLNVFLEADIKSYWRNLKGNRLYLLVLAFYGIHVIGLFWTSNFNEGIHDLKVKLPILVIPTILAAKPVVKKPHLLLILFTFLASTFVVSIINFSLYQHWIGQMEYADIRGMSLFSSHIRFALIVSMSIAILLYLLRSKYSGKFIYISALVWFVFYTMYSQVISGVATMFGVFIVFTINYLWHVSKGIAITLIALISISIISLTVWLFKPVTINPNDYRNLTEKTSLGHSYLHSLDLVSPETGKPIYLYLCEEELESSWPKYSNIPISGKDKKGQPIKQTLIRYLASKDLTKDAEGLSKLNSKDIDNIEQGYASVNNYGIMARLYGIKYQINNESDPNGHSLLERMQYWKAGLSILSKNYIVGVGTGDVQDSFNSYYEKTNSVLLPENRCRSHNMYLTVFLSFGVLGIVLFLLMHYQFLRYNVKQDQLLAILFCTIAIISFIIEDTLETQTGVTFYALFYGLYSYSYHGEAQNPI